MVACAPSPALESGEDAEANLTNHDLNPVPRGARPRSSRDAARTCALVVALAFLGAGAARAQHSVNDPGAPFLYSTVEMPRSAAMAGAQAAVATSNDAIFVNPAGLAQGRRYQVEVDGVLDPQFPATGVVATVVDSTSAAVASGLAFARFGAGHLGGRGSGFLLGAAYAYNLGGLYFGGVTKYLHFDGPAGQSHTVAEDFGVLMNSGGFSYAATAQNVSLGGVIPLFPPTATAAIAFGNDADYHLALDYKVDLTDTSHLKHKLSAGYELLLQQFIAPRIGFARDFTQRISYVAAGIGFLTEKGSFQFAYHRRISGGFEHYYEVGITLFLE